MTTTWNPSDASAGVALTNANLTATVALVANNGVRATQSHTGGKPYWEITIGVVGNVIWLGVADSTFTLTNVPGGDVHALSYSSSGLIQFGGATLDTIGHYIAGDVVSVAVDIVAQLLWVRVNGGIWNGNAANDPTAGTGGYSFSGMGAALFPEFSARASSGTANFGASAFVYPTPVSFSSWDARPVTRLSLDGYGAKRTGSFVGKVPSTPATGKAPWPLFERMVA